MIAAQPEIQPALRWVLLLLLCACGWLWSRRRFAAAASLFLATQCGAILFWTVQLNEPLGLDRVPAVQESWARARVAHEARDNGLGYVSGTRAPATFLTRLAAAGVEPTVIRRAFLAAPIVLVLALAFAGFCVSGSPGRRWLTVALAATSAPLWGLVADLPRGALLGPEATLIASLILVLVAGASRLLVFGRKPAWLSTVVLGSLCMGAALTGGITDGDPAGFDWLLLSMAPLFALMLTPSLRSLALALRSPHLNRTRVEAALMVSLGAGSSWFWWEPARTIAGFEEARDGTAAIDAPLDWLRKATRAGATIASPKGYAALISERTGRQVLLATDGAGPGPDQPYRRERLYASLLRGEPDHSLAASFGVTHLFLGPGDPDPPEGALRRVFHDANDFRVFEVQARQ